MQKSIKNPPKILGDERAGELNHVKARIKSARMYLKGLIKFSNQPNTQKWGLHKEFEKY